MAVALALALAGAAAVLAFTVDDPPLERLAAVLVALVGGLFVALVLPRMLALPPSPVVFCHADGSPCVASCEGLRFEDLAEDDYCWPELNPTWPAGLAGSSRIAD